MLKNTLIVFPIIILHNYRNKMDFSFTPQRWLTKDEIGSTETLDSDFALGFHVPKVYSKVIDIEGKISGL